MIIKQRDLYTNSMTGALMSGTQRIGSTTIQYEVQRYVDTRNLTHAKGYVVTCTQRFSIPNTDTFSPTASDITSFSRYPALITNALTFQDPNSLVSEMTLIDYSPKTANTSVTSSQNQATSANATNTQQYSSGSSVAQTNSFGMSISEGFFGDMPTEDLSMNSSTSTTGERSQSQSMGRSVDTGAQYSNDSSMALKDWGSYAQLDAESKMPTWIWGQEYPWDLIDFRNNNGNDDVVLPTYVVDRLYDGTQVYPPSELSLLGVNFVSKASWLVKLGASVTDTKSLSFTHTLTLCTGTHQVSSGTFTASIDTYPDSAVQTVTGLDLAVLALDPVGGANGPALVAFIPGHFDVPPSNGAAFQIAGDSNLMLVRGTGFVGATQTGFMTTDFSQGAVSLTLSFKVIDSASDMSLSFKHWTDNGEGVTLAITVNDAAPISRRITAPEAGSGGDNVTVVPLRKKDFRSVDFCDLLAPGLNTVQVSITSDSSDPSAQYTLMAVAVG